MDELTERPRNNPCMFWQNFRTGEVDELSQVPTDFIDYVPNMARGLFLLYIDQGMKPIDAFAKVLIIAAGKETNNG